MANRESNRRTQLEDESSSLSFNVRYRSWSRNGVMGNRTVPSGSSAIQKLCLVGFKDGFLPICLLFSDQPLVFIQRGNRHWRSGDEKRFRMAIAGELTKCEVHSVIQMDRKNLFSRLFKGHVSDSRNSFIDGKPRLDQDRRLRAECNHREYISRLIQFFNNFLGQSCRQMSTFF